MIELGSPSITPHIVSAVNLVNEDILALSKNGVIFSVCRHSAKVLLYQTDVDCDDFISIPCSSDSASFIIPIGSNSSLKILRLEGGNMETAAVFAHETKVTSHCFKPIRSVEQSGVFLFVCGTASGAVAIWKIQSLMPNALNTSKSDPNITSQG